MEPYGIIVGHNFHVNDQVLENFENKVPWEKNKRSIVRYAVLNKILF